MKPKILYLPIKRKWFDMIVCGIKKEEYRDVTPYWLLRIVKAICLNESKNIILCLHVGYNKNRLLCFIEATYYGIDYGVIVWGANTEKQNIFLLGKILKIGRGIKYE